MVLFVVVDNERRVSAQGEKRRRALLRVLEHHQLRPVEIARMAGLRSANSLYNLIHGHSNTLTAETYQKIADVLPGVTIEMLSGETTKKVASQVLVKTAVQGGVLRDQFSLPKSQIRELPLPVDDTARQAGAFAAVVKRPGAELIYPAGSLLLCVPIQKFEGQIGKGRRLVVERFVDLRLEVTVRQIEEDGEGKLWLSQKSDDPRLAGAVRLPAEIGAKPWRDSGEKFAIAGVVIGAFVPEG
jgi:hypothetical protein